MIPIKHIDPDDIALYAMQLLPPDETEEMSLHLQHSAEARRVLSELYGDLSIFAHSADMHSPPALARQRLMKHVAREKKAVPAGMIHQVPAYTRTGGSLFDEDQKKRGFAAKVLPWAGWALAAGMVLPVVGMYQQRQALKANVASEHAQLISSAASAELAYTLMETVKDPAAMHVTLTSTDVKPLPQGRATYLAEKGSLVFTASNLEPLQPYKTYELWLIPADGRDPIPAGTFQPDNRGYASVVMPTLPKGVQAKTFGVTIEDGEGSSLPTMPIILKGSAT